MATEINGADGSPASITHQSCDRRSFPERTSEPNSVVFWVQPCRIILDTPLVMGHSSSFGSSLFSEIWRLIAAHESAVKASQRTNRSTITPLFFMLGCTRLSCFLLAIVIIQIGYVVNTWCKSKIIFWKIMSFVGKMCQTVFCWKTLQVEWNAKLVFCIARQQIVFKAQISNNWIKTS